MSRVMLQSNHTSKPAFRGLVTSMLRVFPFPAAQDGESLISHVGLIVTCQSMDTSSASITTAPRASPVQDTNSSYTTNHRKPPGTMTSRTGVVRPSLLVLCCADVLGDGSYFDVDRRWRSEKRLSTAGRQRKGSG